MKLILDRCKILNDNGLRRKRRKHSEWDKKFKKNHCFFCYLYTVSKDFAVILFALTFSSHEVYPNTSERMRPQLYFLLSWKTVGEMESIGKPPSFEWSILKAVLLSHGIEKGLNQLSSWSVSVPWILPKNPGFLEDLRKCECGKVLLKPWLNLGTGRGRGLQDSAAVLSQRFPLQPINYNYN